MEHTLHYGGSCHTVKGRPDSLYYLPELNGGGNHFMLPVPEAEIHYAWSHIIELEEENIF